ncbi:hypothetical protein [Streptomyces montanisoli]|uniref:Uncharacterized protein n=1 Tax=Streptomyces montanisoli TaxID=2798581 RepID=A0A940MG32_9ACTN|nr:hypothetical protein [Streptomyces montanisoli]MBP0458967.1 hypothetical protein [Streptomyces montanisoli]
MPHHALEILLTRPLTATELRNTARTWPLAANHDATRLMALAGGATPQQAAHRLRRRLTAQLPIDVITTHYPDTLGRVLLNLTLPPALHAALERDARHTHHSPEHFLQEALHRALAEHADREAERLEEAVRRLLAHAAPAHLLSAVGHALARPVKEPAP